MGKRKNRGERSSLEVRKSAAIGSESRATGGEIYRLVGRITRKGRR